MKNRTFHLIAIGSQTTAKFIFAGPICTAMIAFLFAMPLYALNGIGGDTEADECPKFYPSTTDGFLDVTVRTSKDDHQISWTVKELQTSLFMVQRSDDMIEFEMVGHVQAMTDYKNTVVTYCIRDRNRSSSPTHYRVVGINMDRSVYYSEVRTVVGMARPLSLN